MVNCHDCNLVTEGKDAIERCMVYSKYSFLLRIPYNEFNNAVETIWVKISEGTNTSNSVVSIYYPKPSQGKDVVEIFQSKLILFFFKKNEATMMGGFN